MIKAAALVAGSGEMLQTLLDCLYFKKIPDLELVAVLGPCKGDKAIHRAQDAGIPVSIVDPEMFPNSTSHSMAVANKLKDMDVDLVILDGYHLPLGIIPYKFRNRVISVFPSLCPAFQDYDGEDIFQATLDRGVKITGATACFCDCEGRMGPIILQRTIQVEPEDTAETLQARFLAGPAPEMLVQAVYLFCCNRLSIDGNRVKIL